MTRSDRKPAAETIAATSAAPGHHQNAVGPPSTAPPAGAPNNSGANGNAPRTQELLDMLRENDDESVLEQLVLEHLPLLRRICRKFGHSGEPLDDLIQVGAVGLLKAIRKYDPARGNNLGAFAVPVIVGEIKNYFRDHGWAVKMPRKLQRQKLAVDRTVETLIQVLGRWPKVPEIAAATGLSDEQVYETFEVGLAGRPMSLDEEYARYDGEDPSCILDCLGSRDPNLEALAEKLDLQSALRHVDTREQTIIRLKFYAGLTQTEIGRQLGISQMHVSRLERGALMKLKRALVDNAECEKV